MYKLEAQGNTKIRVVHEDGWSDWKKSRGIVPIIETNISIVPNR